MLESAISPGLLLPKNPLWALQERCSIRQTTSTNRKSRQIPDLGRLVNNLSHLLTSPIAVALVGPRPRIVEISKVRTLRGI
jgi:hypothetical protein